MSTQPVVPASAPVTAAAAVPAPKTAVQTIESELSNWLKEKEQMLESLKAVNGAIQGAQRLLALLRAEEQKALAAVKKVEGEIKPEAEKIEGEVKTEVGKAESAVEGVVADIEKKL